MMRRQRHTWGGTSIADEESNTLAWVAAAVGVGVLIVIIFGLRSDDEPKAPPPPATETVETGAATRENVQEIPPNLPPPEPTVEESRGEVASELASELQSKRLWSEVEAEPGSDVVVIRSAYCEEPELRASIRKLAPRMTSQGVRGVACYARHGALVFEEPL